MKGAPKICLKVHSTARNAAFSTSAQPPGSIVATISSLATCLLPSEKAKRCDVCHVLQSDAVKLKRCSGCASFWYCGTTCQTHAWKSHHRKLCKGFNAFAASTEYQALTAHDQVDALLLSQMVVEPSVWRTEYLDSPYATFMDLMKGPRADAFDLPLYLPKGASAVESRALAQELHARFGNNNFVLHSHLTSYAHGVFPLASRLFNHSCVPNAACKYIIEPEKPVTMQVVALRDIGIDEEITIPYLDPALPYRIRREALEANYGFTCECSLCRFQRKIDPVSSPPERGGEGDTEALQELDLALRTFTLGANTQPLNIPVVPGMFETTPPPLYPVFHESYLPALSEVFSKTSHEGSYADAVESGLTLLALYALVYPPNYPQIGMHALELSKTLWNLICTAGSDIPAKEEEVLEAQTRRFLDIAASVLESFGPEGDDGGPLGEIQALREALGEPSR
ncbi:SET domain-containing protein [Lenzites betulinus]|nr:SET domain-containing protein [Lenzites betulinus]